MTALLDVDQLRTFIAIAETGSFTKAADVVNKTQSAVSMQMKRLEERLERPIFARDGRASKLTEDGQRLLDYARRIVKLNVEALAAFADAELFGRVRLGVPDDYADRYLPEIMARFSRAYPGVELSVICDPSIDLLERIDANETRSRHRHRLRNLARLGNVPARTAVLGDVEPPFGSSRRALPLALGRPPAAGGAPPSSGWKRSAGLTASATRARTPARSPPRCCRVWRCRCCRNRVCVPACACSSPPDGFPELPTCHVGLVRNAHESSTLADALADHIISSLDNLSERRKRRSSFRSIRIFRINRIDRTVPFAGNTFRAIPPPA